MILRWKKHIMLCVVVNSCRHVSDFESKALEITTFRDKLRECYRYREWAEREFGKKKGKDELFLFLLSHGTDLMLMRY